MLNLDIEELYDFFQTRPSVQDKDNATKLKIEHGAILFKAVTFGRDALKTQVNILDAASFEIPAQKITFIVGKTGAGKTTILDLIFRQYNYDGSITIDDQEIADFKKDSLQAQISILPQQAFLFRGTIRENLLPGQIENIRSTIYMVDAIYSLMRPKRFTNKEWMRGLREKMKKFCRPAFTLISSLERNHERVARKKSQDENLMKACKNACIWDDIQGFNKGLDTEVGERGKTLSKGQQLRLKLAMTLIRNFEILLLDEPTDSLDPSTRKRVMGNLRTNYKGKTMVIITHIYDSIQPDDNILLLNGGKVEPCSYYELGARSQEQSPAAGTPLID
uniref:ABC transporter domain-containing protein n=1 Tax=Bionectria ochroleuca TaxID=29856 RepID=A0A8H7N2Z2_BIOOC